VESYGTTRERAASVSYGDIEAAARRLMLAGDYPSVGAVRKELNRGSTTTIAEAMRRFWRDQAALNAGNPVALTRLPTEFADAAAALWEQALRLSQQTALVDDNAARAALEQRRRDIDQRVRSMEMRETEWDIAARVRERALSDAREQISLLMSELSADRAAIRARDARIADLESQLEENRRHLATVIARAIARNRTVAPLHQPRRATAGATSRTRKKRRPLKKAGVEPRKTIRRPLKSASSVNARRQR
jgi:hypothetical protein